MYVACAHPKCENRTEEAECYARGWVYVRIECSKGATWALYCGKLHAAQMFTRAISELGS